MLTFLKKALFAVVFLFLMAVAVEVLLGVVFFVKDYNIEPMEVKDYPYLYYLFADNSDDINEDGFKTEATRDKDENKVRVMIIGGSVVRGRNPDHTISAYLEKIIQDSLNSDKVEVINAGLSAYVLQQEFILTQSILQHYDPDMIIGLDGYNDMLTFKLNRFEERNHPLPPHNWQDFKVIEKNRYNKSFASRFTHFFRYITRSFQFVERSIREKNFSWDDVREKELERTANQYGQIMHDIHTFCLAKGILYRNFLQPVRYYPPEQQEGLSKEKKTLAALYRKFERETQSKVYGYSLADIFANQRALYRDDCHVSKKGHRKIARQIYHNIKTDMQRLLLQKPQEFMDIDLN